MPCLEFHAWNSRTNICYCILVNTFAIKSAPVPRRCVAKRTMVRDPLLLNIPESFHSERLTIRIPRAGDGAELSAAVAESFEDLRPWMPWAQGIPSVEDSESHCRKKHAQFLTREDMQMLLFLKNTSVLVGSSGLHRIDWSVPRFELGYWVRSSFQGKGYISEGVLAITEFAFTRLHARRVEIRADELNTRSWRVAERTGYVHEGTLQNYGVTVDGRVYNLRIYAQIR